MVVSNLGGITEPSVTVLFQVEVGWTSKIILGAEGQGTGLRPGEQQ
jgi:hypothetical protein